MRKIVVACTLALTLSACAFSQSTRVPASHFVFPNSNVVPTKFLTSGSSSTLCGFLIFQWNGFGYEEQEEAFNQAIKKGSGDILINAHLSTSMIMVPYLFSVCTTSVEGNPAKMTVGQQELR
jgi:hypothetical protein